MHNVVPRGWGRPWSVEFRDRNGQKLGGRDVTGVCTRRLVLGHVALGGAGRRRRASQVKGTARRAKEQRQEGMWPSDLHGWLAWVESSCSGGPGWAAEGHFL